MGVRERPRQELAKSVDLLQDQQAADLRQDPRAVEVAATFLSSTRVNCTSPYTLMTGDATVEVSVNGGATYSGSHVTYHYQPTVAVLSLTPTLGPTLGGTNVSVIGLNLLPGSVCRFGATLAHRSTWLSANELVCMSPDVATPDSFAVEVSANGQDWTSNRVPFAFVREATVRGVSPPLGHVIE